MTLTQVVKFQLSTHLVCNNIAFSVPRAFTVIRVHGARDGVVWRVPTVSKIPGISLSVAALKQGIACAHTKLRAAGASAIAFQVFFRASLRFRDVQKV